MCSENTEDWKKAMRSRIRSRSELEKYTELSGGQSRWFERTENEDGPPGAPVLPFMTTGYYLNTALNSDAEDSEAILRQIIPLDKELEPADFELSDPLGEHRFSPFPRFVHRYADRALILVTDECAMFCRHCFRRSFSGGMRGALSDSELLPMLDYLEADSGIAEVLLTGGDPLTLSDGRLMRIISALKERRPDLIIRIGSRMPVVLPSRLTPALAGALSGYEGMWLVTHFNHPAEFTAEASAGLRLMRKAGVGVLNQTVLLRGVNDDVGILRTLFRTLLAGGVKPYYLFQGDLAEGTSHLRVPLSRALSLTAELRRGLSGMAMPRFAVDLPGGGGKVTLPSNSDEMIRDGDYYIFKGLDDEDYRYPAD